MSVRPREQRLVAIGDSITLGHWDPLGGWIARLRQASDARVLDTSRHEYAAVYNLGVSSNTSRDVADRFKPEVSVRLVQSEVEEAFIVVAVGINDSQIRDEREPYSVSDYASNLRRIGVEAGSFTNATTVFVGPTPVDEAKTDPVSWDETKSFRNARISDFSDAMAQVAEELSFPFVDLFHDPVLAHEDAHINWDGLHLSWTGHDRIAHLVGRELSVHGWRAWAGAK
jgi:lysophospholipase L1-like esterase